MIASQPSFFDWGQMNGPPNSDLGMMHRMIYLTFFKEQSQVFRGVCHIHWHRLFYIGPVADQKDCSAPAVPQRAAVAGCQVAVGQQSQACSMPTCLDSCEDSAETDMCVKTFLLMELADLGSLDKYMVHGRIQHNRVSIGASAAQLITQNLDITERAMHQTPRPCCDTEAENEALRTLPKRALAAIFSAKKHVRNME